MNTKNSKKKVDRTQRQKQGISKWIKNNLQGTLEYCTGFGKTFVALMCNNLLYKRNPHLRVVVVVPTLRLQEQWILKLEEKKLPGEVYVINTISSMDSVVCDLLILDEIHRYGGTEFSKVFNVVKYNHILGLTGTFERLDGKHKIISKMAPVIDTVTIETALANNWLSEFIEYKVMIEPDDIEEYEKVNREFLDAFSYFQNDFGRAMKCCTDWKARSDYTKTLMNGVYNKDLFSKQNKITLIKATTFNRCLRKRKEYIYNHPEKIRIAQLILDHRKDRKCITFSSRVKGARAIKRGEVLSSKAKAKEQREIMEWFINTDTGVLNTCSMLDEGVDIPKLSLAIILGFTSSKTSKTQRIGRVIRKEGDKIAEVFTLVLKGTVDEQWFYRSNTSEYVTIGVDQLLNVLEGKPFTPKKNVEVGFKIRF